MGLFAAGSRLVLAGLLAAFLVIGTQARAQDQAGEVAALEPWPHPSYGTPRSGW